jgi:hypothetical protein
VITGGFFPQQSPADADGHPFPGSVYRGVAARRIRDAFRLRRIGAAANIRAMSKTLLRPEAWMVAVLLAFGQLACGSSSGDGGITGTLCTDTFNACGGEPTGNWTLSGFCLDGDLVAGLNSEQTAASCSSQTKTAQAKGSGTANYMAPVAGDGVVVYDAKLELRTTESISPACAADAWGVATLDATGCTQIQTAIKAGDANTTVTCAMAAGNCDCTVDQVTLQKAQNLYTLTGSNIVESDDSTYDICVNGMTMTQRQNIAGTVNVISTFTKK